MNFLWFCLPRYANITKDEARTLFGSDENSESEDKSDSNELTDANISALERLKTKLTTEETERVINILRKFRKDATLAEKKGRKGNGR